MFHVILHREKILVHRLYKENLSLDSLNEWCSLEMWLIDLKMKYFHSSEWRIPETYSSTAFIIKCFYPACVGRCLFRYKIIENVSPQISRWKSFAPVCVDMCLLILEFWENAVPQISQWNLSHEYLLICVISNRNSVEIYCYSFHNMFSLQSVLISVMGDLVSEKNVNPQISQ